MFADEAFGVIEFRSKWRSQQTVKRCDVLSQTNDIVIAEVETQSYKVRSERIQTDTIAASGDDVVARGSLISFLRSAEQLMVAELDRNIRSHAFDDYVVDLALDDTQENIVVEFSDTTFGSADGTSCSCIGWNSTGVLLALGHCQWNHEHWCSHKQGVSLWNVDRLCNATGDLKQQDGTIETDWCVLALSFHPNMPSVLAIGGFSGEVQVWSVARGEEALLASSGLSRVAHQEPVTALTWSLEPDGRQKYLLISAGSDGRVLVWKLTKERQLKMHKAFLVTTEQVPRHVLSRFATTVAKGGWCLREVGISAAAVSRCDPSLFVVGLENGAVLQCSLLADAPAALPDYLQHAADAAAAPLFLNPTTCALVSHNSPVLSVCLSSFERNFLATCSSDVLHLYNLLNQTTCLAVIDLQTQLPTRLVMSPHRPLVLCCTTAADVLLYDLSLPDEVRSSASFVMPKTALLGEETSALSSRPLFADVTFNERNCRYVATVLDNGGVTVWKLPETYCTVKANEEELLRSFIALNKAD